MKRGLLARRFTVAVRRALTHLCLRVRATREVQPARPAGGKYNKRRVAVSAAWVGGRTIKGGMRSIRNFWQ